MTAERTHAGLRSDHYFAVAQFLAQESRLLDEDRLAEWLDLLDDSFTYSIPLRVDRERRRGGPVVSSDGYRIHDSKPALKIRIDRLYTGRAWAEELPSRMCRVVGSIELSGTDESGHLLVNSALLIHRQRANNLEAEVIPARHRDVIRLDAAGTIRLISRVVLLSEKSLATTNLAVLL